MKAVIMAGGEGTRLRPLTLKMPKPLVPVLGESVMSYIIRLLKKHKISDAAITLMFLPEQIQNKYKSNFEGVDLFYFEEKTPLGTAGSVKNTKSFLLDESIKSHDDFFIVISGDAICDTDITKAADYHKSTGSDVTIVLSKSENPLEFGGVVTDSKTGDSGIITAFIEKPSWSQVFTDTVNTGIYIINNKILDIIPDEKFYDFGRDLFPLLQENKNKYKMSGYADDNYWCDIGDLNAYYQCNIEAENKRINIINETGKIKTYRNYSQIGENCDITGSIIHEGVKIGDNAKIIKSVICKNTEIGDGVKINEGCIIGQDCRIEKNAVIAGGVKIWNNKVINEGEKIMSSVIFSGIKYNLFDNDDGITGVFNDTLTPEYCVKIGTAAGMASSGKSGPGRVGVMSRGKNNISGLIKNSLLCGIAASGAKSYDFGEGFASLAAFAAGHFKLDAMLFAGSSDKSGEDIIKIYDCNTLSPSRTFERKFEAALLRDDCKPPLAEEIYPAEIFEGLKFLYFSELLKNPPVNPNSSAFDLKGFKVSVKSNNPASEILKKALKELSADIYIYDDYNIPEDRVVFEIGSDGFELWAYDNNDKNNKIDFWHIIAILIKDAAQNGETEIALPYLAPQALQTIAEEAGADVLRYISCPFTDTKTDSDAKSKIMSQLYLKDACFASIRLCFVLRNSNKNLNELISALPRFISKDAEIEVSGNQKTKIMRSLNEQIKKRPYLNKPENINYTSKEGMTLDFENGRVNIIPKKGSGFKLMAEALSVEAADEIIGEADGVIRKIINNLK